MPTYRMLIAYDGRGFSGWQVQPQQPTVQAALEKALAVVVDEAPPVVGSGRTDTGVHARGQVAHFETAAPLDCFKLQGSLNGLLPRTIGVLDVQPAPDGFHARYDARQRRYHYYIATRPCPLERHTRVYVRPAPDVARMNEAATYLVGTHLFESFCRTRSETRNRVCTVTHARWVPQKQVGHWCFQIAADRFLHGMVRAIVGTLLEVGRGRRDPAAMPALLAAADRVAAGPAAPAHGLVLEAVSYEGLTWPGPPHPAARGPRRR